jgi:hypothetical protein
MQNETFVASAAKVVSVNTGAAVSMATNPGTIGTIAGLLAATYSIIQIVKSLPWLTDYTIALCSGLFKKDWSHWRAIARRTERGTNDES